MARPYIGSAPFDWPSSATLVGDGTPHRLGRALVLAVDVDDEPVGELRPPVRG